MARGDQLSRQWRLIRFLDHPNGFTVDEAARELGCTVRTVWRDLAVLQKASFPLYDDKDGRRVRYRLVDGFRAKLPAPFTLSEVVALLMSRDLLAPTSGSVLAPSVHAAFAKIRALLPDKAHRLLDEMRTVIGVRALGAKLLLGAADFLTPIHQALLERRTLDLDYFAFSKQEETTRFFRVLFADQRGWNIRNDVCHGSTPLPAFSAHDRPDLSRSPRAGADWAN